MQTSGLVLMRVKIPLIMSRKFPRHVPVGYGIFCTIVMEVVPDKALNKLIFGDALALVTYRGLQTEPINSDVFMEFRCLSECPKTKSAD